LLPRVPAVFAELVLCVPPSESGSYRAHGRHTSGCQMASSCLALSTRHLGVVPCQRPAALTRRPHRAAVRLHRGGGVVENKHFTGIEFRPPLSRVCMMYMSVHPEGRRAGTSNLGSIACSHRPSCQEGGCARQQREGTTAMTGRVRVRCSQVRSWRPRLPPPCRSAPSAPPMPAGPAR